MANREAYPSTEEAMAMQTQAPQAEGQTPAPEGLNEFTDAVKTILMMGKALTEKGDPRGQAIMGLMQQLMQALQAAPKQGKAPAPAQKPAPKQAKAPAQAQPMMEQAPQGARPMMAQSARVM